MQTELCCCYVINNTGSLITYFNYMKESFLKCHMLCQHKEDSCFQCKIRQKHKTILKHSKCDNEHPLVIKANCICHIY